jgi:hypothetical protein
MVEELRRLEGSSSAGREALPAAVAARLIEPVIDAIAVFDRLADATGVQTARLLFREIAKGRPGRPPGPTDRARQLLATHDSVAARWLPPKLRWSLKRLLSESLHRQLPGRFGNSAKSIEETLKTEIRKRSSGTHRKVPGR